MDKSFIPCIPGAGSEFHLIDVYALLYRSELFSVLTLLIDLCNSSAESSNSINHCRTGILSCQLAYAGIFLFHGISAPHIILDHPGWNMDSKAQARGDSFPAIFWSTAGDHHLAFVFLRESKCKL